MIFSINYYMRAIPRLTTLNYKLLGLVSVIVLIALILSNKWQSQRRRKMYSSVSFFIQIFIEQLLLSTYH